ncbi:hypothetical protein PTI98_013020 [Pleurotus ostreatus]|nr:hypothetical protein PTI98_013020 [Pleurotus ostreatus]
MANWIDLFSLFATIAVFGGIIYGVLYLVNSVSQGVASTKEALANKGLHISDKGVSVKTSKRFDREDYVDATQRYVLSPSAKHPLTSAPDRGFIKAMNAASFGHASSSPQSIGRSDSNSSLKKKNRHD